MFFKVKKTARADHSATGGSWGRVKYGFLLPSVCTNYRRSPLVSDMLRTVPTTLFFTLDFAHTLRTRVTPQQTRVSLTSPWSLDQRPNPILWENQAFSRKQSIGSSVSSVYTLFNCSWNQIFSQEMSVEKWLRTSRLVDFVYNAVFFSFFGRHKKVAVNVFFYFF